MGNTDLTYQGNRSFRKCGVFKTWVQSAGSDPNPQFFCGLRTDALEVILPDGRQFLYDLEGRPLRNGSVNEYRFRGLSHNGTMARKRPLEVGGGFEKQALTSRQITELCRESCQVARSVHAYIHAGHPIDGFPSSDLASLHPLLEVLAKANRMTPAGLEAQGRRFLEIYRPITVLPPDQYLAFVLQLTEGCPFNRCTFCNLYRDTPFQVKKPDTFAQHLKDAVAFHGDDLKRKTTIFLGQANALGVPFKLLAPLFEILRLSFEFPQPEQMVRPDWARGSTTRFLGLHSFIDGFTGLRHGIQEFQQMRTWGLRRVYLGLESGCQELLDWLDKPAPLPNMQHTLQNVVAAGLAVDPILLVGAGGAAFAKAHIKESLDFLKQCRLPQGNRVYLSPMENPETGTYGERSRRDGIRPLTHEEIHEQRQELVQELRAIGLQPVPYRVQPFAY